MGYELFWKLTPKRLEPFVQAFKQKNQFEAEAFRERTNFAAWLQGIYFAHAIAANFSNNAKYFDQPISFKEDEKGNETEVKATKFEAWSIGFNSNFKEKKEPV